LFIDYLLFISYNSVVVLFPSLMLQDHTVYYWYNSSYYSSGSWALSLPQTATQQVTIYEVTTVRVTYLLVNLCYKCLQKPHRKTWKN